MRRLTLIFLVIGFSLLGSGYSVKPALSPPAPGQTDIASAEIVLQTYLDAVDRGELMSFGQRLGRQDITPVRVEYSYEIATGKMITSVYSNLKQPMPVPGQPGAKVYCIKSTLEDGKIVETESHVWIE